MFIFNVQNPVKLISRRLGKAFPTIKEDTAFGFTTLNKVVFKFQTKFIAGTLLPVEASDSLDSEDSVAASSYFPVSDRLVTRLVDEVE